MRPLLAALLAALALTGAAFDRPLWERRLADVEKQTAGRADEAVETYRALLAELPAEKAGTSAAQAFLLLNDALRRAGRLDEWNTDLEAVLARFGRSPAFLCALAEAEFPEDGYWERGHLRRGTPPEGVWPVSTLEYDRQRLLTAFAAHLPEVEASSDAALRGRYLLAMAKLLLRGREDPREEWLERLTPLDDPDRDLLLRPYAAEREAEAPPFFARRRSWAEARNDGERCRWALETAIAAGNPDAPTVLVDWLQDLYSHAEIYLVNMAQPVELADNEILFGQGKSRRKLRVPADFFHLTLIQQFLQQDPKRVEWWWRLADYRKERCQHPAEADALKHVLALAPKDKVAREELQALTAPILVLSSDSYDEVVPKKPFRIAFSHCNARSLDYRLRRVDGERLRALWIADLLDPEAEDESLSRLDRAARLLTNDPAWRGALGETLLQKRMTLRSDPKGLPGEGAFSLPPLPAGVYLFTAQCEKGEPVSCLIFVLERRLISCPAAGGAALFLMDAVSGEPVSGGEITVYRPGEEPSPDGGEARPTVLACTLKTDAEGRALLKADSRVPLFFYTLVRDDGNGMAISRHVVIRPAEAAFMKDPDQRWVITDSPVYRPGETVELECYLPRTGDADDPVNAGFTVWLLSPEGAPMAFREVVSSELATFHARFPLPENASPGNWNIRVKRGGTVWVETHFRVADPGSVLPAAPKFEPRPALHAKPRVETETDEGFFRPGDTVRLKVRARYADGAPVAARGETRIYQLQWEQGREIRSYAPLHTIRFDLTAEEAFRELPFRINRPGVYGAVTTIRTPRRESAESRLTIRVRDEEGRTPLFSEEGLKVLTDRAAYRSGDTANLLFTSRYKRGTVYCFLRRAPEEDEECRIVPLENHHAILPVSIDEDAWCAVEVDALLFADGEWQEDRLIIPVRPTKYRLEIGLQTAVAEDRGTLTIQLRAAADDKPTAGNVTVSIFDQETDWWTDFPFVGKPWRERLLWVGRAAVDESGEIALPFAVPNAPARWRVEVWAAASGDRRGHETTEFTVEPAFSAHIEGPRFLRIGDRAELRATLENGTAAPLTAEPRWEVSPELRPDSEETPPVSIPAKDRATVSAAFTAAAPGKANVALRAGNDDALSAAAERSIPILPAGSHRSRTAAGTLTPEAATLSFPIAIPESADPDSISLTVCTAPDLAYALRERLLRMTPTDGPAAFCETLLPVLAAPAARRNAGLRLAAILPLDEAMDRRAAEARARLIANEAPWGYFLGSEESPRGDMTAAVVRLLAESGDPAALPAVQDGCRWLEGEVARRLAGLRHAATPEESDAEMLEALAEVGGEHPAALELAELLYERRQELTTAARLRLARVFALRKAPEKAAALLEMPPQAGENDDPTLLAALRLRALVEGDPRHPEAALAARKLVESWRYTPEEDSPRALWEGALALAAWVAAEPADATARSIEVAYDGTPVRTLETKEETPVIRETVTAIAPGAPGSHEIVIRREGQGDLYCHVVLTYRDRAAAPASGNGLALERKLWLCTPDAAPDDPAARTAWTPGTPIPLGTVLETEITLNAASDGAELLLRDPLPAGCAALYPVNGKMLFPGRRGLPFRGDFRPADTRFFNEWLPRGVTALRYRMIAAVPGEFAWPGASAQSLRTPALRAESAADTITISAE